MRGHEILGIIKEYIILGIIGVLSLGILGGIGYFLIYRKLLGGKKKFSIRQIIMGFAFTGYIIMVIGVTLLSRGEYFHGSVNLHFLSTYREAWNDFTLRGWQQIIFNIIMFLPLGVLLPLMNERFHKIIWSMGFALGFTAFIESVQLITGFGIFEIDDMFNNVLGALIGYGIIMAILTAFKVRSYRFIKVVAYLSPLILVIVAFASIFTYYNFKEFGNLSIAYSYRFNMKNAKISLNQKLNDERIYTSIYKASQYNKETGKEFVISFFENLGINTDNIEVNQYSDSATYWSRGNPSYCIRLNYLNGSYDYTDFSSFDEEVSTIDQDTLLEELNNIYIHIPAMAVFNVIDKEEYQWTVEREIVGNTLTEGSLYCRYYSDGTIKEIRNNIITYKKVIDIPIKSETEAFNELKDGKFRFYGQGNSIESIDIRGVELDYRLDSKGYYQPVYSFDCVINGQEFKIGIPALLL